MICLAPAGVDGMKVWALTRRLFRRTLASRPSMGARRISIDPELLEWLYVEETLSIVAIAARLGCADNTVLRRLRRAGIEVRPRGPIPRRRAPRADQVETFRRCLRLEAPISQIPSAAGIHDKVQWCDRGLYDWFLDVGLTPAKSRTIGPLAIPDGLFADFFRGCLDSDGSVLVYTDAYHAARRLSTSTSVSTCRWSRRAVDSSTGSRRASAHGRSFGSDLS